MKDTKKADFISYLEAFAPEVWCTWRDLAGSLYDQSIYNKQIAALNALGRLPEAPFKDVGESSYWPIELFKSSNKTFETQPANATRVFQSSGTGGQESLVPMSEAGVELYRRMSMAHFRSFLKSISPKGGDFSGISFIPNSAGWPQSSLAQMLTWIAQEHEIEFQPAENAALPTDRPIWLFGTMGHFLNYLESSSPATLHPDSVIIETGGSKNLGVSPETIRQRLSSHLKLNPKRIYSEYGMSELSCQAYGVSGELLQFPPWVLTFVQRPDNTFARRGLGCLTVWDPSRIDCPLPIRTQDIVDLSDKGFRYVRRLQSAPLKGCSMLAQTKKDSPRQKQILDPDRPSVHYSDEGFDLRLQNFLDFSKDFFSSKTTLRAIAEEIGSPLEANRVMRTLHALTQSTDWKETIKTATNDQRIPRHWLYILPGNHSVVGIYPMCAGALLNQTLHVRVPTEFNGRHSFLNLFLKGLSEQVGTEIRKVPSAFMLGDSAIDERMGAVICYGTNETVESIAESTNLPTITFGSQHLGLYLEKTDSKSLKAGLAEALHMGQKGCLSTRLFVTKDKISLQDIQYLQMQFQLQWQSALSHDENLALLHLHAQFAMHGFALTEFKPDELLLPVLSGQAILDKPESVAELVTRHPFVLPIVDQVDAAQKATLARLLFDNGIQLSNLSDLPSQVQWDGRHLGQKLFAL